MQSHHECLLGISLLRLDCDAHDGFHSIRSPLTCWLNTPCSFPVLDWVAYKVLWTRMKPLRSKEFLHSRLKPDSLRVNKVESGLKGEPLSFSRISLLLRSG